MTPLATFVLAAALIVATATSATLAAVAGGLWFVALALQLAAQAGVPDPPGPRTDEQFDKT